MKILLKLCVLFTTIPLMTGCWPIWGNYYHPYLEGGIEKNEGCNSPITRISIEAGTGLLTLSALTDDSKPSVMKIRFVFEPNWAWVKDGYFHRRLVRKAEQSTLVFHSDEVAILLPNSPLSIKPTLTNLSSYSRQIRPANSQLPLQSKLELIAKMETGSPYPEMYSFDYEFPLGKMDQFKVVIPEFNIDEISYKSRTVQFVKNWEIWISPLNGC